MPLLPVRHAGTVTAVQGSKRQATGTRTAANFSRSRQTDLMWPLSSAFLMGTGVAGEADVARPIEPGRTSNS
ncbi:hypothetical protein LMH87_011316 [Akanthomyces muscarius]|uniref:Uncharacterized protein n=1 Tax=Akanthomyces muscarius TaxID=2231603 RepID=A0A9W8QB20_AKAMU|nr:hypothetical protein LMH87_011316 [Akanthomyces muscarius]KAJ4150572.1 hypothetical protein LMH87_011316 [Akanthomyces muscarius]